MPTVLLVRHGRTQANTAGILAGWTPGVVLDEVGSAQVQVTAARIQAMSVAPALVVSSPLQRCVQTAAAIAGSGPTITDDRLGECHYGAWTGASLASLAKEELWRVVQDHPSAVRFPDGADHPGESMAQMSARAVAAIRDHDARVLAESGPGAMWVAVSHGDVIKAILADAAGLHLDLFQRLVVDPASVSVVRYTARRPFVVRLNDTGSDLAALVPTGPIDSDAAVGGGAGGPGDPASASEAEEHELGSAHGQP